MKVLLGNAAPTTGHIVSALVRYRTSIGGLGGVPLGLVWFLSFGTGIKEFIFDSNIYLFGFHRISYGIHLEFYDFSSHPLASLRYATAVDPRSSPFPPPCIFELLPTVGACCWASRACEGLLVQVGEGILLGVCDEDFGCLLRFSVKCCNDPKITQLFC
jgi:hypothetical protein